MAKLTKSELLTMENNIYQQQVSERELENLKLKKHIEVLNGKLAHLELQIKLSSYDKQLENSSKKLQDLKTVTREYNNKLKDKYKVSGPFGINPDTGEILEEE